MSSVTVFEAAMWVNKYI